MKNYTYVFTSFNVFLKIQKNMTFTFLELLHTFSRTLKVWRGWEMGKGYPLPSQLMGLGSVVSCPSGVQGEAPAEIEFYTI